MIVIDLSGSIEFFADGPHAEEFAARLRSPASVLTPTNAICEVYKWIKRERSEEEALPAVAAGRGALPACLEADADDRAWLPRAPSERRPEELTARVRR